VEFSAKTTARTFISYKKQTESPELTPPPFLLIRASAQNKVPQRPLKRLNSDKPHQSLIPKTIRFSYSKGV